MILVGLDTETHLISTGNVLPQMVCFQVASRNSVGKIEAEIFRYTDPKALGMLRALLKNEDVHFACTNSAYDTGVITKNWPELIPLLWDALEAGRVHDIALMEKLLLISTTGDIGYEKLPDGSPGKLEFHQTDLEKRWLGVDRSDQKEGDDVWRLRYSELEGIPVKDWPEAAVKYAKEDAVGVLMVAELLFEKATARGHGSMVTEAFQAAVAHPLMLATARGVTPDQARVDQLDATLSELLSPEKMRILYDEGLLTPPVPERDQVRKKKDKATGETTLVPVISKETGLPKRVRAKAEKKNMEPIKRYIAAACAHYGVPVKKTTTGEVCTDADVKQLLANKGDPVVEALHKRDKVIKLQSTYLPLLRNEHGVVHFGFNPLVTSGRTSSRGSSLYASGNGQNQPRNEGELSTRECIVAREGFCLLSVDYSAQELASVGQTTYSLFGKSQHFEKINEGRDPHAWLGTQIAKMLDGDFRKVCSEKKLTSDQAYDAFLAMGKSKDPELQKFFSHYRRFAKPTGLGYPGGLGAKTFVDFARMTYGVVVDQQTAEKLREAWFRTYPEMRKYFRWVNQQADPKNAGKYAYTSPLGMYRAGCGFTEAANGMAMQTPSAEGAKIALLKLGRELEDPTQRSILIDSFLVNFIHDEVIVEIPRDDKMHERAMRVSEVMISSMNLVMPDVTIRTEACLTDRWYKGAKPVYDASGRLQIWSPEK
ncbi:MAG: hypothetical protein JKY94_17455 [Rhodobacteraceae bacterium]|nr:hypothetical protein [Paracoccaceae bacterium]